MDPAIDRNNTEQMRLEAAKAAFFAANGSIQQIPRGIGKGNSLAAPGVEPPRYGYTKKATKQTGRGRYITDEEKVVLAAQLMECKVAGLSRYKAAKHIGISETLCRRLIADYSLDFPVST